MNGGAHWFLLVAALAALVYFKVISFPTTVAAIVFFAFAVFFGYLASPDIDQRFGVRWFVKHRGFTHGFVWLILIALGSYALVSWLSQSQPLLVDCAFWAGAGACLGAVVHDGADLLSRVIGQY